MDQSTVPFTFSSCLIRWSSRIGLGLVFGYCLLASIFYSYFAQIHLSLSFLHFPIFIGEIVMGLCVLLLSVACKDGRSFTRRTTLLLGLYFGWVGVRALVDYHHDGPLALRNAALFYYPVFAVFGYVFYQKSKLPRNVLTALALLAAGVLLFKFMMIWYWWTYVSLFAIALCQTKSAQWRWLGWVFLAAIVLLGKDYLFNGPRAHFVSIFGSGVFLVFYFGAVLAKRRDLIVLRVLLISFLFFIIGFIVFSNRNAAFSVMSIQKMIDTYQGFDFRYQLKQARFAPQKLPVRLYNPKNIADVYPSSPGTTSGATGAATNHPEEPQLAIFPPAVSPVAAPAAAKDKGTDVLSYWLKNVQHSPVIEKRSLALNEINIVFRLFVWRDMARELIERQAWWGFSFGHPQRSRSLEVLGWAKPQWSRDGWITPHNSFFHIIYRAGILGVFLIGILFSILYRIVADFFNLNSIEGGFLVGALVYWLIASNFFVILEFPYNAIVFWSLFGITLAYRDGLKQRDHEK